MKKIIFALSCFALMLLPLTAQQVSAPEKLQQKQPKADNPALPVSPLMVDGSRNPEINLGRVFKLSQRIFKVVIENPSDKPVEYTGVVLNCDCTKMITELPPKGVIPAKGSLKIVMRIDATQLGSEKRFFRMMRFELKDYRHFVVSIVGELSRDLAMVFGDDPERQARTQVTVGCLSDPAAPWKTRLEIISRLPENEEFELGSAEAHGDFVAALYHTAKNKWNVELSNVPPMKPGIIRAALMIPLLKPAPPEGMKDVLFFPIIGVCGAKLNATVADLYNDPAKDPRIVTKRFAITREPYMDSIAIAAVVQGRPNPYVAMLKILKVEEIEVPRVEGVTFKLSQGDKGVYVDCTMDRAKMTEKGCEGTFKAKEGYDEAAVVNFAIMSAEVRKELEEERLHQEALEAEERAAQAAQDSIK